MGFLTKTFAAAAIVAQLGSSMPLTSYNLEPCAEISAQIARVAKTNGTLNIEGLLAYNCLRSMPFDGPRSAQLVKEITKHVQLQSTLETLKNPPKSYVSKPVDILGGLKQIEQKAANNSYTSQYDFDLDVRELISSANEGHLNVEGLCTFSIWSFSSPVSLLSLSKDGRSAPSVYVTEDVIISSNSGANVSEVVTINGQNASAFLEKFSSDFNLQDPDARYNALFTSPVRTSFASRGGMFVSNNGQWPGFAKATMVFKNGTSRDAVTAARFIGGRSPLQFNYTNGRQVFDAACLPLTKTSTQSTPTSTASGNSTTTTSTPTYAPTQTAGPANYPEPVLRDPYNSIAGFYLDGKHNDTAVLFVPTFGTSGSPPQGGTLKMPPEQIATFADVAANFTKQAKADGKKRIIIDISSNPGGTTISGFNLFKLFFPKTEIWMANRYRSHPIERLMLKGMSDYAADYGQQSTFTSNIPAHWAWQGQVAPDGGPTGFTKWEDFYGPESLPDGSNLTSAVNFNNFTAYSTPRGPIQGYSNITSTFSAPPFSGQDILIMGDAACGSTCPIFINLMKQRGSSQIHTVAFGGRPNNKPMQLMGGTRGSELFTFERTYSNVQGILNYAQNRTEQGRPVLTPDELKFLNESSPISPDDFPLKFNGDGSGVNLRNAYNEHDPNLALQFAYEPADCRLYFTPENVLKPSSMWVDAAEAIWGKKGCIKSDPPSNDKQQGGWSKW